MNPTRSFSKDDWSELAGVDDIRDEIREAVRSHFDPVNRESLRKLSLQPPKGVLFFGPPGTGKTKLARLIAAEAQAAFYAVSGTEFTSKWYGESEANLRRIFETAQQNRPAVLFFDELEAFLPRRGDLSRSDAPEKGILATFLSYTDGVASLDGVFLVGATNHPELIDPAALRPGRFDKVVYVSAPDAASRRMIFERYLANQPLAGDVNLDKLATMSERFTGADIQSVCKEAVLESVVRGGRGSVDMAALTSAIGGTKPSVTLEMLRTYEKIADQYGRRSRKAAKVEVVAHAELGWDSVAGLEDVKNALREAVEMPLQHVELFQQYGVKPPKGVLLFGPPGCGKTLLAKVIAKVARANCVHIKGPELLRQMTGQSEAKLRECFDRARESAPCVLFFDEIDALAGARGTENASGTQILPQFLIAQLAGSGGTGLLRKAAGPVSTLTLAVPRVNPVPRRRAWLRPGLRRTEVCRATQNGSGRRRSVPRLPPVIQHAHFFHRHQPAAQHGLDPGQVLPDFPLVIDDFHHQGQIHRELQDFGGVQAAGFSKSHRSAQDGGPSQSLLARLEHNGLVERAVLPPVAFTDEHPQQNTFLRQLHVSVLG